MNFYVELKAKLAALSMAPICEFDQRPAALAKLAASLVTYELQDTFVDSDEYVNLQDWWGSYNAMMRDVLGFTYLGNGFFSAAYSHPMIPGRVIKVGFKKEDSGAAYAAFCRANQGLMGIPNVYDIQRHDDCYTVILDHLQAYSESTPELLDAKNVIKTVIMKRDDDHHEWCEPYDDYTNALADTAKVIFEFFNGIAGFDLHNGNIMVNSQGQVVITDPVSYTNGLDTSGSFRVDFDDLCEEIAAKRQEEMIERAWARKDRHLNRKEARKAHRRIKIQRAKNLAEWERSRKLANNVKKADDLAWERVVGFNPNVIGEGVKWQNPTEKRVWLMNPMNIIHQLDAKMHNEMVRDIVCGNNLAIDRKIDAMFMG